MTTAIKLARYIINKCAEDEHPITNLQLQKILYYVQREYLRKHNEPAFVDDIEAWKFGPVVPEVYYTFCYYGGMSIDKRFEDANAVKEDIDDLDLVDEIVVNKRELEPWGMVSDTHKPGSAWDKTYQKGKGNHQVISIDLIRRDR